MQNSAIVTLLFSFVCMTVPIWIILVSIANLFSGFVHICDLDCQNSCHANQHRRPSDWCMSQLPAITQIGKMKQSFSVQIISPNAHAVGLKIGVALGNHSLRCDFRDPVYDACIIGASVINHDVSGLNLVVRGSGADNTEAPCRQVWLHRTGNHSAQTDSTDQA